MINAYQLTVLLWLEYDMVNLEAGSGLLSGNLFNFDNSVSLSGENPSNLRLSFEATTQETTKEESEATEELERVLHLSGGNQGAKDTDEDSNTHQKKRKTRSFSRNEDSAPWRSKSNLEAEKVPENYSSEGRIFVQPNINLKQTVNCTRYLTNRSNSEGDQRFKSRLISWIGRCATYVWKVGEESSKW